MIEVQKLIAEELQEFQTQARATLLTFPIFMIGATIFGWLFDFAYLRTLWITTVIVIIMFLVVYIKHANRTA